MRSAFLRVDTPLPVMHDKSMTNRGRGGSKRGPFSQVKHGSAVVPIYRGEVYGRTRYTVAFYLNQQRVRRTFSSLDAARAEARTAAQKIQEGMSAINDISPQRRDSLLAAERIVGEFDVPLVTAADEYARCRKRLGGFPLMSAVEEFLRRTSGVKLGAKVGDVVKEFLESKRQDQISKVYLTQLTQTLARLMAAFPGDLLHIQSSDIDRWLRGFEVSPVTRNTMLRCVKVFFSFAKTQGFLPRSEPSAAEMLAMVKTGDTKTEIFSPEEFVRVLAAAPQHLVGLLAVGGFAGLRAAEMERLDWSAVDLDRRIITLRADQAKTASRRIVPISENLARWVEKVPRSGKVVEKHGYFHEASLLAQRLGIQWPCNGLRHSFISYRLALINDVNKVALEAGNSAAIIFKHYRELVTDVCAKNWFSIMPPEGWEPQIKTRRRILLRRR